MAGPQEDTQPMPRSAPLKLTEWTSCGGCAAKWGASLLEELVGELAGEFQPVIDPALLVGLAPFDDAAVYQVSSDVAIVSTTDFFPPLVDDPDDFGAISAANACSDVFAMGGRVVMAVNIAAFPSTFRAMQSRQFLRLLREWWQRPAERLRAVTRFATRSLFLDWQCKASLIHEKYFVKVEHAQAISHCFLNQSVQDWRLLVGPMMTNLWRLLACAN